MRLLEVPGLVVIEMEFKVAGQVVREIVLLKRWLEVVGQVVRENDF